MPRPDDPQPPDDLTIRSRARAPVTDPTLGIPVRTAWQGRPTNRLVTIGDSLTHGFQSGAVYHTGLSYSAIIAHVLGWQRQLRYPHYGGPGGLPLNLELLLRELEREFGSALDWWELPHAAFRARGFADTVEDYWERGPGSAPPPDTAIKHVLGIYGYDLRDALARTAQTETARIGQPSDNWLDQIVERNNARAALRVLPGGEATLFDAATQLGEQTGPDPEHGIETLVVFLGSNNALGAVTRLEVCWSGPGYDELGEKGRYTVWRPAHFAAELALVAEQVRQVAARHVIWCTVPHVTIAPLAHGVGDKVAPGSRYFPYYTRPWIPSGKFDPTLDPHITADQARAVDSAIDQYNDDITAVVEQARRDGRDWYLLDVAGVLDRLANRRYLQDPDARPDWWTPYPLPPEVAALDPPVTSEFLAADETGRTAGGLFSLDGVHPTTVGYGLLAQELIDVMARAGVAFPGAPRVDFERLIRLDTLITNPPSNLDSTLGVLAWADETLDPFRRVLPGV